MRAAHLRPEGRRGSVPQRLADGQQTEQGAHQQREHQPAAKRDAIGGEVDGGGGKPLRVRQVRLEGNSAVASARVDTITPPSALSSAINPNSTRRVRTSLVRPAPSVIRTAISRRRIADRARSADATLVQPRRRITAETAARPRKTGVSRACC